MAGTALLVLLVRAQVSVNYVYLTRVGNVVDEYCFANIRILVMHNSIVVLTRMQMPTTKRD